MFGFMSISVSVPWLQWCWRAPAQETGLQGSAPDLAGEVQFIFVKDFMACRKSNPYFIHWKENSSWRVLCSLVFFFFEVYVWALLRVTVLCGFKKKWWPHCALWSGRPLGLSFSKHKLYKSWVESFAWGSHTDWATVVLHHVLAIAGNETNMDIARMIGSCSSALQKMFCNGAQVLLTQHLIFT